MPTYLGAIDQGTSSTRFIVFDESTRIVAESQLEHAQIYPQPGWVEHDPVEIWRNTQTVIAGALRSGGLKPRDLAAIGITNQRETTVVWDRRTGVPLYNALVWQDTRVTEYLPTFAARPGSEFFRARTGLPLSSYFSSLKIRWILDHVAGARALAEQGDALFGNIDTFLVWHLTGGAARRPARHRRDQRQPHAADEPRHARVGRGSAGRVRHPARDAAGDPLEQRALWNGDRRADRGRADHRHPGRPAGGARRADLLPPRRGEEHVRHRLLPAAEHRRSRPCARSTGC